MLGARYDCPHSRGCTTQAKAPNVEKVNTNEQILVNIIAPCFVVWLLYARWAARVNEVIVLGIFCDTGIVMHPICACKALKSTGGFDRLAVKGPCRSRRFTDVGLNLETACLANG